MATQAVEMILVRQLAGYLFVPVLVVDTSGTVVFYNEPAERILGGRLAHPRRGAAALSRSSTRPGGIAVKRTTKPAPVPSTTFA